MIVLMEEMRLSTAWHGYTVNDLLYIGDEKKAFRIVCVAGDTLWYVPVSLWWRCRYALGETFFGLGRILQVVGETVAGYTTPSLPDSPASRPESSRP